MALAFPIRQVVVPILGSGALFPVRRIYCVGLNYDDHAKEMSGKSSRTDPFFFTKPIDAIVTGAAVHPTENVVKVAARYPPKTENYHLEVELVVAIGRHAGSPTPTEGYSRLSPSDVRDIVFGYAVGLDMTRRDLQMVSKTKGTPWDLAKGADDSAPLSYIVPADRIPASMTHLDGGVSGTPTVRRGPIASYVNGELWQRGDMSQFVTPVEELLAVLSTFVALRPGDLVFTGTPGGVSPVNVGDTIKAVIDNVGELEVKII